MRNAYVTAMRKLRTPLARVGVLDWLERYPRNAFLFWLRSLFAIHDIDDMVRLGVPWWTFPSIRLVDGFLSARPGAKVFEFGAGASTVWLAARAGSVYFVEHDPVWYPRVNQVVRGFANVHGRLREAPSSAVPGRWSSARRGWTGRSFEEYVAAIREPGEIFDLVVVDGRCRSRCLEAATDCLCEDGLIVFDNSIRWRYRAAIEDSGLNALNAFGFSPAAPYPGCTTLLWRGGRPFTMSAD